MVVEDEVELAKREKKNQNLGYKECMFPSGMERKKTKKHIKQRKKKCGQSFIEDNIKLY